MSMFSDTIRGARLGWRWCDEVGAFVRISDTTHGYLVDIRPEGTLPRKGEDGMYRCWWEGKSGEAGRALRRLIAGDLIHVKVRGPMVFEYREQTT